MKTYMSGKPKRKWFMLAIASVTLIVTMPTWSAPPVEETKLFAADDGEGDQFGYSVAVSGDTALIGVRFDDDDANGLESGSAYVFTRSGTTWSQQARLTAADGSDRDWFGVRVALEGDTAVVPADADDSDVNGVDSGSVYVFTRSGSDWSQQAKLTAADGAAGDLFGVRVALAGDTALIGARLDDDDVHGDDSGSAYVFTRSGDSWSQQAKLTAADGGAGDWFGYTVALADDTALIGAGYHDGANGADSGSAYVFTRSGTIWSQKTKLTATDGEAGDQFGGKVAISGDTAVVGARLVDDGVKGVDLGSVYIFTGLLDAGDEGV